MVVYTRCLSFLKIVIICGLNASPKEINRGFLNSIYGLSEKQVIKQAESKASEENAVSL